MIIMPLQRLRVLATIILLTGCSTGYENDGDAVYYKYWNEGSGSHRDRLDADPKTFTVLDSKRYAKDKSHAFFDGKIIEGADPATFNSVSEWFAKDKNRGYRSQYPVMSSRGASFRTIDSNWYSTDGVDVFYDTSPLGVCDTKHFRLVFNDARDLWTTDGCSYYYMSFKVPSDDYRNVAIFENSGGLSKDKNYVYFMNHRLNYDDDGERVVDTIDALSFKVTGFLECRDKWGCINPFHGRESWDVK
jgi:hypothetical protein